MKKEYKFDLNKAEYTGATCSKCGAKQKEGYTKCNCGKEFEKAEELNLEPGFDAAGKLIEFSIVKRKKQ